MSIRCISLRALLLCACLGAPLMAEPVTIFAAASLKTALDDVIATHGLDAVPVYGGSAAMARQIAQGAQADIVILAHPDWMIWLEEQNALQRGSRCHLLGNTLVLAGHADAPDLDVQRAEDIVAVLSGERLAVGHLRVVPAGQYSAAYLRANGWLETLRPHLVETSNVRLALALLARGEVPLGFVYASDIAAEPKVRSVFTPNANEYPAIRYPMAITRDANDKTAATAQALIDASDLFEKQGFTRVPLDEAERCQ